MSTRKAMDWKPIKKEVIAAISAYPHTTQYIKNKHLSEWILQHRIEYPCICKGYSIATDRTVQQRIRHVIESMEWGWFTKDVFIVPDLPGGSPYSYTIKTNILDGASQ